MEKKKNKKQKDKLVIAFTESNIHKEQLFA